MELVINPNFQNLTVTAVSTSDTFTNHPQVGGPSGAYTQPRSPYSGGSRFSHAQNEACVNAEHIVHLSLTEGLDVNWPFGNSVLESIFKIFKQKELLKYLLSDWMDAEVLKPPYVKVTGQGNKEPYRAIVMDPTKNEKLDALSKYKIVLEKVGNESIGVKAGEKKVMKIRFKFESEKMASSVKLSGEPW